jgi:oligopeptidase B
MAPRRPSVLVTHGDQRIDEWFWLRQKENPEVLSHLGAENAYTEAVLAQTKSLQEELYQEFLGRILETDMSVPARKGGWWYVTRTVEGLQYPIMCRHKGAPDGPEQVMLDQNRLAAGHDYLHVTNHAVSPDAQLLAYATDYDGSERYTLHFRNLDREEDIPDQVTNTYYGLAWSSDNRSVFYTKVDAAMRPYQLWRHRIGSPASADTLVYQEDDERYYLGVHLTRSQGYVLLTLESKVTTEVHFLPADEPKGSFQVIAPRRQGVEYQVDHHADYHGGLDRFFIVTNADGAHNFKLVETPVARPGPDHWSEVVPHREDVKLEWVDLFSEQLVLFERSEGLRRVSVRELEHGETHVIDQPEPVYTVYPEANLEFETTTYRFGYSSLVTPRSVFDYDMLTRSRELKKQQPVLGGYDPEEYETSRLWATAGDGVQVPMSLVHRKGLARDGTAPALLYGYGAYEHSVEPSFSSLRLSLLDRGFLYAIAHVRGGGEMGRLWYEDGKLLKKKNTFTDFVACAEHLVSHRYTSPERLVIRGGSAGGLLLGAAVNLRPDLFRAVVAEVPFVDALTTMLDNSLPLTALEWEEWGNPESDPDVYIYMKSYSPYDNVEAKHYPAFLVTAGLNDPRVSYWEPAKWVQKLREGSTSGQPVLLKVEMGAGHSGPSGRYEAWREEALIYAFILDTTGLAPGSEPIQS